MVPLPVEASCSPYVSRQVHFAVTRLICGLYTEIKAQLEGVFGERYLPDA